MKLQLAYESSFQNKFGSRTTHHLNGIMEHSIRLYAHTSLGTRLKVIDGGHVNAGSVPETANGCGGSFSDVGLK